MVLKKTNKMKRVASKKMRMMMEMKARAKKPNKPIMIMRKAKKKRMMFT